MTEDSVTAFFLGFHSVGQLQRDLQAFPIPHQLHGQGIADIEISAHPQQILTAVRQLTTGGENIVSLPDSGPVRCGTGIDIQHF